MERVRTQILRCWLLWSCLLPAAIGGGAHPAKQGALALPLSIHHINVSEGSAVLIVGPTGTTVLIDGGSPGRGADRIVPYLMSLGLMPWHGLDYMIATHHDDDHLGGLDEVILAG